MDEPEQHLGGPTGPQVPPPPRTAPEPAAQLRRVGRAWGTLPQGPARVRRPRPAEPDAPRSAEAEPEVDELTALEQRMDVLCRRAAAGEDPLPLRHPALLKALAHVLSSELGEPRRLPRRDNITRPDPIAGSHAPTALPPEAPPSIAPAVPATEAPAPAVPPPEEPPPIALAVPATEAPAPAVPPPEEPPPIAPAVPAAEAPAPAAPPPEDLRRSPGRPRGRGPRPGRAPEEPPPTAPAVPAAEALAPAVPPPAVPPPTAPAVPAAEALAPAVPPPAVPRPMTATAPLVQKAAPRAPHPRRAVRRRGTGVAIALWSVPALLLGAVVLDRWVAPGPVADQPGQHAPLPIPAAAPDQQPKRTEPGSGPRRVPAAAVRASALEPETPVTKAAPTAAATSGTATSGHTAAAGTQAGAMRRGGAGASPNVPMFAPAPAPTRASATHPTASTAAPRVVVRAIANSWISAHDQTGARVFSRLMHAGQTWTPPRPGLLLTTGNAGGIELVVNGVAGPPLGRSGAVLHEVPLDPARLSHRLPQPPTAADPG